MQDRPTAWELLDGVAELLEETLMPATEGGVRHQARVAANLCRIVQRELEQGGSLNRREAELLLAVLEQPLEARDPSDADDTLALSSELSERLLAGDPALEARAWPALVEIVCGKLAVTKPGYADYDYAGEAGPGDGSSGDGE